MMLQQKYPFRGAPSAVEGGPPLQRRQHCRSLLVQQHLGSVGVIVGRHVGGAGGLMMLQQRYPSGARRRL